MAAAETAGTHYYSYDNVGNPTGETLENTATVTRAFDSANRLTSVTNKNSSGTTLSSFSYGYSSDNQRTSMTEADGSVVDYTFDAQHHLTEEARTGTDAYTISYTVDGVGNRTAETIGGTSTSFTLNSDDELTATSGGFTNSYSYNSNGEQTGCTLAGTSSSLAFDYDGQLTSITTGTAVVDFAYDALGRRISRTAGGTTTQFLSGVDGQVWLEAVGGTTTATYTWGPGLCRKDSEYPMQDGQGNERTVLNSSQTVTGTTVPDAFGNQVGSTGSSSDPYMYGQSSGYRNDGDCGLTLVGAAYYDAQVGRFAARSDSGADSDYSYCNADPVSNSGQLGGGFGIGPYKIDFRHIPPWIGPIWRDNSGWILKGPRPVSKLIDLGLSYLTHPGPIEIGNGGTIALPFLHPYPWKPVVDINLGSGPGGGSQGEGGFPWGGGAGLVLTGPGGGGYGFIGAGPVGGPGDTGPVFGGGFHF